MDKLTRIRRLAEYGIVSAQNYGRLSVRVSKISTTAAALAVMFMPLSASALTIAQALGFFNILIGLLLTAAVISFGAGLVLYWTRYGTWPREEAFPFMSLAVTILFVVSALLAIIHFIVQNTSTALYIVAVIAFFGLAGIILFLVKSGKKKEEKPEGR
ncbi:MAG TPA: hypothetical protein VJ043_01715 [Candidatus Paceibacterota bacterium]|nr:hypothetical protein [Candidatus Paceibacterota bacterium]